MNISNITKKKVLVADPPITGSANVQTDISPPVISNLDYVENTSLLVAHQNLIQLISDVKSQVSSQSVAASPVLASQGVPSISPSSLNFLLANNGSLWAQASSEYESTAWSQGQSVGAMMYSGIQSVEQEAIQSYAYLNGLGSDAASWAITPEVRRVFQRRVDLAGSFMSRLASGAANSIWNSAGDCFLVQISRLIDGMAGGVNTQEVNQIVADLRSKPVATSSQQSTFQSDTIAAISGLTGPMSAVAIAYSLSAASTVLKAASHPKERKWKSIGDEIRRQTISLLLGESMAILNNLASTLYYHVNSPILQIGATVLSTNLLGECPIFDNLISSVSYATDALETELIYKMYIWENEIERKYGMLNSMADMSISRVSDTNQINILSQLAMVLPSVEVSKGASQIMQSISSRI